MDPVVVDLVSSDEEVDVENVEEDTIYLGSSYEEDALQDYVSTGSSKCCAICYRFYSNMLFNVILTPISMPSAIRRWQKD